MYRAIRREVVSSQWRRVQQDQDQSAIASSPLERDPLSRPMNEHDGARGGKEGGREIGGGNSVEKK